MPRWKRPAKLHRNLVGESARLGRAGRGSYIAATVAAKVTLWKKHRMGGTCLQHGLRAVRRPPSSPARVVSQIGQEKVSA